MTTTFAIPEFGISAEMLQRFDIPGPRYTSYPTADRFVEAFGEDQYRQALCRRSDTGVGSAPLSVYVHIPFCESVCYYCACNKVITKHHERASEYIAALEREIDLHVDLLGRGQTVSQVHLGGGSPTFLSDDELARLMAKLQDAFRWAPGGEYSIEVDPRTVSSQRLAHLASLGFNRLSFGVQDFEPKVQKAVHRVQSMSLVSELMFAARELRFDSINVDLIYGLPRQTAASFEETVEQVSRLRPDRLAVYGYAHLPQRFKPQRRIDPQDLPLAGEKVSMLGRAISRLLSSGYTYIGMDHFALTTDTLAVAKRQGRLHRNFQGYSTQSDCDLIGLGVSSIGRVGVTYSQNAKSLPEYYDAVLRGRFPIVRGLALTRDELVRRAVIMALMCQGHLVFESIELSHLISMRDYFQVELQALSEFEDMGLIERESDGIKVTPTGWFFVRAIAMVFDRYLRADQTRERFSRVI